MPRSAPIHSVTFWLECRGTIEIDPRARVIDIDLMICLFPAFEAYASIDDDPAAVLFRQAPPAGILSLGLPLSAKGRILSRVEDAHDGSVAAQVLQNDDE